LSVFNPYGLWLVIILVCKHGYISLTFYLSFASDNCAHSDRPTLTLLELITRAFVKLFLCEPECFFIVQALAAQPVSTNICDGQHWSRHVFVNTFKTSNYFQHSFCNVITSYVHPKHFQSHFHRFLRCLN